MLSLLLRHRGNLNVIYGCKVHTYTTHTSEAGRTPKLTIRGIIAQFPSIAHHRGAPLSLSPIIDHLALLLARIPDVRTIYETT